MQSTVGTSQEVAASDVNCHLADSSENNVPLVVDPSQYIQTVQSAESTCLFTGDLSVNDVNAVLQDGGGGRYPDVDDTAAAVSASPSGGDDAAVLTWNHAAHTNVCSGIFSSASAVSSTAVVNNNSDVSAALSGPIATQFSDVTPEMFHSDDDMSSSIGFV